MDIPMKNFKPSIDFMPFIEAVCEKYGFNYHDMAGAHSKEAYAERDAAKLEWMNANNFEGMWHVLNLPKGSKEDWAKDSFEMNTRIAINNGFEPIRKSMERPYQNVWHWLLDNDFDELLKGGINYLNLYDDYINDLKKPEYVRKVLHAIRVEVEDNPAFDGEMVRFHIDW